MTVCDRTEISLSPHIVISISPRNDHAVLGQPILEALLPEVVRTKQGLEALANRVKAAMGHEGRAQKCAKDEVVAERVEALGILERGRLGRRLGLHFESRFSRIRLPKLEVKRASTGANPAAALNSF